MKRRDFLHATAILASAALAAAVHSAAAHAEMLDLEKDELNFGFIKLTDMAPLAIAYEKGYFEDEGLYVTLEPQANWKVLLDRVITGELDGAHMLAGQPLAATIGYGTKAHIITPFSMDLNGNGITVSNEVWEMMKPNIPMGADGKPEHPISAAALKPVVEQFRAEGRPFNMGMVFPVSTHNYELRYWLAAGGIHPGFYSADDMSGQIEAEALLSVTPPPQMPSTLEAGTIYGYCVGEPWNQQAVFKGIGVPVITDYEIWKNNPEKVFGITAEFAEENPNTTLAVTKALIRAAKWLDENDNANRAEAVEILSQLGLCRRRRRGHRQLDDRHLRVREGRQADGARLQRLLPLLRHLSLLLRRRLVPHPDAPLGPDRRSQAGQLVRRGGALGLPPGHLSRGRAAAGRRRTGGRGRLPLGHRRLPATDRRLHRRHPLRRPQAQRLHRFARRSGSRATRPSTARSVVGG